MKLNRDAISPAPLRLAILIGFAVLVWGADPVSAAQEAKNKDANAPADAKGTKSDEPEAKKKPEKEKVQSIFPDKALEEAVRKNVFSKRYNDEPILKEDVEKLSQVVGAGQQIRNLTGLEHCRSLMLIDLRNNQISDLKPLAKLDQLQSLTLSGNRIKDITPLENLTGMQLLDLSRNEVSDLAVVQNMGNLRTLYVAENQLHDLKPISELTKIWSLDASGNKLQSIEPVSNLRWLTSLSLRNNKISDLSPIGKLDALKRLRLENNKITDLTPLVECCKADAEGDNRFAPYLNVYLSGNPLDPAEKKSAIDQLRSFGVRVK